MSKPDLQEVREGIDFCRNRISTIEGEFQTFASAHHRLYTERPRPDVARTMIELLDDLPVHLKRDVGLTMNELRAQLDHLANVLARRNGANADDASFPLLEEAVNLNATARRKVRQLSPLDQQRIWDLQPFQDPRTQILIKLHHADIIRKHHRPLVVRIKPNAAITHVRLGAMYSSEALLSKKGDAGEILWISSDATFAFNIEPVLEVVEPPEMRTLRVNQFLKEAADAVSYVVGKFD